MGDQDSSGSGPNLLHVAGVAALAIAALIGYRLYSGDQADPGDGVEVEGDLDRSGDPDEDDPNIEQLVPVVQETHPHETDAFTQGLLWHDGMIYESTGLRGESTLRRVALETGEVEHSVPVDDELFAEGLARVDSKLVQLTWQAGKALVYDLDTFELTGEHDYEGEGWGLCYDGERLVMSDGSDVLTFRDPETFETLGEVNVTRGPDRMRNLNELECVEGFVFANVWTRDAIAKIDPESGEVVAWIDASALRPRRERGQGEDVLNGIAYVPETGRFLLTGKRWPELFEVTLEPR